MQDEVLNDSIRGELLERLKALEGPQTSGSLDELAYRRAREALEKALEEARTIRLQAIDDARANRERELAALLESLKSLRQSAQVQIDTLLREAELQAERTRGQAESEARTILDEARAEAEVERVEARLLMDAAKARAREVDLLEAEFNKQLAEIAKRLGLDPPKKSFFSR